MKEFTVDEKTEIGNAFAAGNYASAYEGPELPDDLDGMPEHERAAFILGFYSSCELHEIGDREEFDAAYHSDAGRYVVDVAGYCEDRDEDYRSEVASLGEG